MVGVPSLLLSKALAHILAFKIVTITLGMFWWIYSPEGDKPTSPVAPVATEAPKRGQTPPPVSDLNELPKRGPTPTALEAKEEPKKEEPKKGHVSHKPSWSGRFLSNKDPNLPADPDVKERKGHTPHRSTDLRHLSQNIRHLISNQSSKHALEERNDHDTHKKGSKEGTDNSGDLGGDGKNQKGEGDKDKEERVDSGEEGVSAVVAELEPGLCSEWVDTNSQGDREGQEPPHEIDDNEVVASGTLHLAIKHWDQVTTPKVLGDLVVIGDHEWRLMCFPRGNTNHDYLAVFVELIGSTTMPPTWAKYVHFYICLKSVFPHKSLYKGTYIRFTQGLSDWGFTKFIALSELENSSRGLLAPGNTLTIEAKVTIAARYGPQWPVPTSYDSKLETGFVGLHNQGATCYMNSILQTLYCVTELRAAVYAINTEDDNAPTSVPLALQRIFFQLQMSKDTVDTTELTRSFGWNTLDAFMQHDVQEFNRVLCDNLEMKMRGTPLDGTICRLFCGSMKSYVKCISVPSESTRTEQYYDIQLNVKGMEDIYASFEDYISVETLTGDNMYRAEGYGLQEARKGVVFQSFPPVLHIQLKRFEYDLEADTMVKVNDHYKFNDHINLDRFLETPEDTPADYTLHSVLVHAGDLHGGHYVAYLRPMLKDVWYRFDDACVTRSSAKHAMADNFGFDMCDLAKTPSLGPGRGRTDRRFTNAYMLAYIRDSMAPSVLNPLGPSDIPRHLVERFTMEAAELDKKRKEQEEDHNHMTIKVAQEKHFAQWHEYDLCGRTPDNLLTLNVHKMTPWSRLKAQIASQTGVALPNQRLWMFIQRRNTANRPESVITVPAEQDPPIFQLASRIAGTKRQWWLFLEEGSDGVLPPIDRDSCLVFIKYYSTKDQTLQYVGHLWVRSKDPISSLYPSMSSLAGLSVDTDIDVYVEREVGMVNPCYAKQTVMEARLSTGDILSFEQRPTEAGPKALGPVKSRLAQYYLYLDDRVDVTFSSYAYYIASRHHSAGIIITDASTDCNNHPLSHASHQSVSSDTHLLSTTQPTNTKALGSSESLEISELDARSGTVSSLGDTLGSQGTYASKLSLDTTLNSPLPGIVTGLGGDQKLVCQLSKRADYNTVANKVGEWLEIDPEYLRFYSHDPYLNRPGPAILRKGLQIENLAQMLGSTSLGSDPTMAARGTLYYEVLPIPLSEMETKHVITLQWRTANGDVRDLSPILMSATSTVADLLCSLRRHVTLSPTGTGVLRLLEVCHDSIKRIILPDTPVAELPTYFGVTLRAEEIPDDQISNHPPQPLDGHQLQVKHLNTTPGHTHNVPFYFVVRKGEPFVETRHRLMVESGARTMSNFKRWQVLVLVENGAYCVQDDTDILYNKVAGKDNAYIGLDHASPRPVARPIPVLTTPVP